MSETMLLVVDGNCNCPIIWQCSHGKKLRLATATDIPPDLATEALGLSMEDLEFIAKLEQALFPLGPVERSERMEEAACRVREAEAGKGQA